MEDSEDKEEEAVREDEVGSTVVVEEGDSVVVVVPVVEVMVDGSVDMRESIMVSIVLKLSSRLNFGGMADK